MIIKKKKIIITACSQQSCGERCKILREESSRVSCTSRYLAVQAFGHELIISLGEQEGSVNDTPVCIYRRCIRDVFRAGLTSDIRRSLVFVAHAFCMSIRATRSRRDVLRRWYTQHQGEKGQSEGKVGR